MRRFVLILLLLLPHAAFAQGAATLVADSVTLTADEQLIATGNIEVLYAGTRLTATQIIYDGQTDQLFITGPIVIHMDDGTILTAQAAQLDPTLENGMLQGARIVLDQQLQLAANQIDRRDGRYSQLFKTVATSCQVCGDRAPLWSIRAERVVHDTVERQLYFENATLRIRDIPVLWLPRMRLPDPTLERATGFLVPEQRNTNQLGTGIKVPYFVTLGNYRDVTLTPYLSAETRTLELIYRQAFHNGNLRIAGAVSDDTLQDDSRSYVFANGNFDLSNRYKLAFNIEAVSDRAYLLDYSYSDKDRLDSAVSITRITDTTLLHANLTFYQTLRDDETNSSLPPIVANARYETRSYPRLGGTLTFGTSMDSAYRYSSTDGDAGRDVTRFGAFGTWENTQVLRGGVVASGNLGLRADYYSVQDDTSFPTQDTRISPSVGAQLRWPLASYGADGSAYLIEPTISLGWADAYGATPPNEDSTRSALDRGNVFDMSRFAGDDAVETGLQGAVGVSWTRVGPSGGTATLAFGRVIRDTAQDDFTPSSGLDGLRSDWLVAGQVTTPDGFLIDSSALFDATAGLTVVDSRIAWQNDRIALDAAYIWQDKDVAEGRTGVVSEWTFDAGFKLSEAWTLDLDGRYDIAADSPVRAGIGLGWQNECVKINVSASRRYTSSTTVDPTTTYGLSGALTGFSAGRSVAGLAAGCRN